MRLITLLFLASVLVRPLAAEDWQISLTGKSTRYDSGSENISIRGTSAPGLISAYERNGKPIVSQWLPGAFRPTVTIDDEVIIDGFDTSDVGRVTSFRVDRGGSYVYVRQEKKGPTSKVRLIHDGQPTLEWPRRTNVRVIAFTESDLTIGLSLQSETATRFVRYARSPNGEILDEHEDLGSFDECGLLGVKARSTGLLIEANCSIETGSDVFFLDEETKTLAPISNTSSDELLAYPLLRPKGTTPILEIDGSDAAQQAFFAVQGLILSGLGEPGALASDEAGQLSWTLSYRLRALAEMHEKTGEALFADLAAMAMSRALEQRNERRNLVSPLNPPTGWASRIYSTDGQSPITLMVNQAMIMSSMITACKKIGPKCPDDVRDDIDQTAVALADYFEAFFDPSRSEYRIQKSAPFRFDGIWAPWNWQMAWAPVLRHAGAVAQMPEWSARAEKIAEDFLFSWTANADGSLWHYWTPSYYVGWHQDDNISSTRPIQKTAAPKRYEDTNHAGISLLGLSESGYPLARIPVRCLKNRLQFLMRQGTKVARDLDGAGPVDTRWMPGAGWHLVATQEMKQAYSNRLPGSSSGDQLLAYAQLFDPQANFQLNLTLKSCALGNCAEVQRWRFSSFGEFLTGNPLFKLTKIKTGKQT